MKTTYCRPTDGGRRRIRNVGQYLHGATFQKTAILVPLAVYISESVDTISEISRR
jgi:hypothetical protein